MDLTTKDINPATTFDLPGGGSVEIKSLTVEELHAIRKQTRSVKPNRRGVMVEKTDDDLASELMWDACIVSWKGITLDGKALACSRKNKKWLMEKCPDFSTVIGNMIESVDQAMEVRTELASKN